MICLIGGVVASDTTAAFQVLISHPLVACTLAGLVLHDVPMGLTIGILLELLWLAEVPVGGVRVSEGNVGALVSASVAIWLGRASNRPDVQLFAAVAWGVMVAVIGGSVVTGCRRANVLLLHRADAAAARGDVAGVATCHVVAMALSFAAGALLTAVATVVGLWLLSKAIAVVPASWDGAFGFTRAMLIGAGVGAVCMLLLSRRNVWAATAGLGAGLLYLYLA
ncbi:MAG: PTS sugar transporter subunit IIC [candidate division KSB1 bacterium]|nr:PTS sugar transporter subunit IIC [candidate division KSB1 bacterium]